MYLLNKDQGQNNRFTFKKFFYFDSIAREHPAVEVISMDEFLKREVMQGNIQDPFGNPAFPPDNRTKWEGHVRDSVVFWHWWRNTTNAPLWDFSKCAVGFAAEPGPDGVLEMLRLKKTIKKNVDTIPEFINNPTNVYGQPADRLREILGSRKDLCVYNDRQQKSKVMVSREYGARHFCLEPKRHLVHLLCLSCLCVSQLSISWATTLQERDSLFTFMRTFSLKIGVPTCGLNDTSGIT